jgi:putative two-component system response regulator
MNPPTAVDTAPVDDGSHCFAPAATAQMERLVADFGRMYQERNEALAEVTRAHHEALLQLSLAAEYRDADTGVHIVRIGYLAEALALSHGAEGSFARLLRQAAPMHDIGKIGIPDAVLKKPGPLEPEEREVMKRHPAIGAEILARSRIPVFRLAAEVAMSHHERYDGTGYPLGRVGTDIPLSGRLVAVVDFFDALTMDRVYRPAVSDDEALAMLRAESGKAFDPRIIETFERHAERLIAMRDLVNRTRPGFADLIDAR